MQDVRYYVRVSHHEGPRESVFRGPSRACPGCVSSAYRKSCVLEILEPWLPAALSRRGRRRSGDDRSLTENFLLRKYRVIYSSGGGSRRRSSPEHHRKFPEGSSSAWKKSWLRECLIAATFMWKEAPAGGASASTRKLCFPDHRARSSSCVRSFTWPVLHRPTSSRMAIYAFRAC